MLDQYRSSLAHVASRNGMYRVALHYHRVERNGEPHALSLQQMPFLAEVYRDLPRVRELVAMKCTQVGWTEAGLAYGFLQTGLRGRRHAIVLPDDDNARTFVQDRLQPLVDRVPFYAELVRAGRRHKKVDNVRLMHVGSGTMRVVGSMRPSKLREFPADSVLVDEVDECNQANLPLVRDRVRNSDAPQLFWFGNPRIPGGISKMYDNTDQRAWFHRCPRCGHRQVLDWFANVVDRDDAGRWVPRDAARGKHLNRTMEWVPTDRDIRPVCVRCKEPWTRTAEGCRWVVMNPGLARRGYHVSRMDHLADCLWSLFREWLDAQEDFHALAAFYSGVLGKLYEAKGGKLTIQDLRRCMTDAEMDYEGGPKYRKLTVVAGVDVGAVFNLVVDVVTWRPEDPSDPDSQKYQHRHAAWVGTVASWEDVEDVLERYHVEVAVVDAQPELHGAQEFRDAVNYNRDHPAMVWLCRYTDTPRVSVHNYGMELKADRWEVQVNKLGVMDATCAEIWKGQRSFPADVEMALGWSDQMTAPIRKLVVKPSGERFSWERGNKRDDYRQAECYARVAADLAGMSGGWSSLSI